MSSSHYIEQILSGFLPFGYGRILQSVPCLALKQIKYLEGAGNKAGMFVVPNRSRRNKNHLGILCGLCRPYKHGVHREEGNMEGNKECLGERGTGSA